MKALLINPHDKTIIEVEYSGNFISIYDYIGQDCFDVVRYERNIVIYVDDEGLFRPNQAFFSVVTYRGWSQPLAGKALVLGVDEIGEDKACPLTLEEMKDRVKFRDDVEFSHMEMCEFDDPRTGIHHIINEAKFKDKKVD